MIRNPRIETAAAYTWGWDGCDSSPILARCADRSTLQNVIVYKYTSYLRAHMWCLQGGRVVAAPAIRNNPKAAVAYSNIDERPHGLATDVPTGGGASGANILWILFRATQILRIKNQVWHRGRRQAVGTQVRPVGQREKKTDSCAGVI